MSAETTLVYSEGGEAQSYLDPCVQGQGAHLETWLTV